MNFGEAIKTMKEGEKVQRLGWNGKGMWLILVQGSPDITPVEGSSYSKACVDKLMITIDPHIDMYTASGTMQPGWSPSQADMFADDWQVVV